MLILYFISLVKNTTTLYFKIFSKYDQSMNEYDIVILIHEIFCYNLSIHVIDYDNEKNEIKKAFERIDDIDKIKKQIPFCISNSYFESAKYAGYSAKVKHLECGGCNLGIKYDCKELNTYISLYDNEEYMLNEDLSVRRVEIIYPLILNLLTIANTLDDLEKNLLKLRNEIDFVDLNMIFDYFRAIDDTISTWRSIFPDKRTGVTKFADLEKISKCQISKDFKKYKHSDIIELNECSEILKKGNPLMKICNDYKKKIDEYLDAKKKIECTDTFPTSEKSSDNLSLDLKKGNPKDDDLENEINAKNEEAESLRTKEKIHHALEIRNKMVCEDNITEKYNLDIPFPFDDKKTIYREKEKPSPQNESREDKQFVEEVGRSKESNED
ncbi:hypothetical protein P3W45_000948 [Vairimorpha bombi]|jgi:hypothetical protein